MFWHGRQMYRRLSEEVRAAGLAAGRADPQLVTKEDLSGLPATVQRYLRAMGVVNRPRDWSLLAHLTGRFRLQGQGRWMPAEVWQYNSAMEVARIFHMRIDFAGVVLMVGRDTYLRGKGNMRGKLVGLVTVARSEGPKADLSELATYLNDAVLMAPSMLLRPNTSFAPRAAALSTSPSSTPFRRSPHGSSWTTSAPRTSALPTATRTCRSAVGSGGRRRL
jgi:hypothetical protein